MPESNLLALRARFAFPVDSPPVENATLMFADGCIQTLSSGGPIPSHARVIDCGDSALLPGFVNAHTHLEFSTCTTPLGRPGMRLPEWIREVVRNRIDSQFKSSPNKIPIGLQESLASGTTLVGEIATQPFAGPEYATTQLSGVAFLELLGLSQESQAQLIERAEQHVMQSSGHFQHGLSPHAPYTVSQDLVEAACRLSRDTKVPVAMHLAESPEELQLLREKSGPFVELLQDLNAWFPDRLPDAAVPLDYLRCLATAHRALVVHGNYLSAAEVCWLAEHHDTMAVIYCPRTHAFFGHTPYPLAQMLDAGVRMALGTDSRASNPDLSLFREIQFLADRACGVSPQVLLELATLAGARALGRERLAGSLTPGKRADVVVVPVSDRSVDDPYELLFESEEQEVNRMWIGGVEVGVAP